MSRSPETMKLDPVQIVHELALNPDAFSVPYDINLASPGTNASLATGERYTPVRPEISNIEKIFKDQMHRAFWARIDQARANNHDEWVGILTGLLVEMRQRLIEILPERMTHERQQLEEALDEAYVSQLLNASSFGSKEVLGLFEFACDLVMRLEAPVRVEQSRQWWEDLKAKVESDPDSVPSLIPDLFRFVNDKLEQIQYDMFYAEINLLRPIAQARAVEFEREHLGFRDPTVTRNWMERVLRNLSRMFGSGQSPFFDAAPVLEILAQQAAGEDVRTPPITPSLVREIVAAGLLELVSCPTPIVPVPECFALDAQRIHGFQNNFQECVLLGISVSLAHTFHSHLKPSALPSQLRPWLTELCAKLSALAASARITMPHVRDALKTHLLSHPALDESNSELAASHAESMAATLDHAFKADHPLYITVQSRVLRYAFDVLLARKEAVDAVRDGAVVPVSYISNSCDVWLGMCAKLLTHNLGVCGDVYAKMLEEILV